MKYRLFGIGIVMLAAGMVSGCGSDGSAPGSSVSPTPTGSSTVTPTAPSSPATSSCAASIAGMPVSVPGTGGRYTLAVTTGSGCSWSAQTDASWASVAPTSGVGSASSTLTVAENPEVTNTRSANLTIAGQVLHFSQANACTFTIDQTAADVNAEGSRVGIRLTTRDGCAWTARGAESWLHVDPTSGSGPQIINVEIDANSGGVRHGTVTIAALRVQITQQGR